MFVSIQYIKEHYREFKICQNCMAINVIRKRKCIACGSTNLKRLTRKTLIKNILPIYRDEDIEIEVK